jgi:3-dehydroquinate synthetase/predicted NBD/HSP70 family sugar kinase
MNEFPMAPCNGDEVVTFDLGGTSFRSALLTREGRLTKIERIPSINYRSLPGRPSADIAEEIALYIARTVKSFRDCSASAANHGKIAISMGAALNAHTGLILGSGPILGEDATPFHLELAIKRHLPNVQVTIVNDVTASLVAHSLLPDFRWARRLALITVSSGIAARTLHPSLPHVPVDSNLGTQGEIGHHRIAFSFRGRSVSLKCDCGGVDHLNAFASGNGIKNVIAHVRENIPESSRVSPLHRNDAAQDGSMKAFAEGLSSNDPLCKDLLMAVTAPVAEAIKWHFMLDPEIDRLILTGGVCFFFKDYYRKAILENLNALQFYPLSGDQLKSNQGSFWDERIVLGPCSDDAGLVGAAYVARELPRLHRRETLSGGPPYRVSRHHAIDYPVYVVDGMLQNEEFPRDLLNPFERVILVIDGTVNELYGDPLQKLFATRGLRVDTIVLRLSEGGKNLAALTQLISSFEDLALRRRRDLIVAVGGGVPLDVAGFAANIFRRGVPFLRIPTTLVGAIDAGIGLKNAVNFGQHKSRIGTYSAPHAVVIEPGFLSTLPDRQIRNGLSEALKIALVADRELFELIEAHGEELIRSKLQSHPGNELICRSIRAMLLELAPNLHERNLDRAVDYGHTFSPIFEFALSDVEHGEAVALDMALATAVAVLVGMLDIETAQRILVTQDRLGLPITCSGMTVEMLAIGIQDARKHRGGRLRMPILRAIGEATFIDEVSDAVLTDALDFIHSWVVSRAVGNRRSPENSGILAFKELAKKPSAKSEKPAWNVRSTSSALGQADA